MTYAGAALQAQKVEARPQPTPDFRSGFSQGYKDVAAQVGESFDEYLEDPEPNGDLYERAVLADEQSPTPHGHDWLSGYWTGLKAYRADLIDYQENEAAEKRLRDAGVTL